METDERFLVIWNHYRAQTTYALLPKRKLSKKVVSALKHAHGAFITETSIPKSIHAIRQTMFKDKGWHDRYGVTLEEVFSLEDNIRIIGVCYTGQLG